MDKKSNKRRLDSFIAAEMQEYGEMTKALDLSTKDGKDKMRELQRKMRKKISDKRKSLGYDI